MEKQITSPTSRPRLLALAVSGVQLAAAAIVMLDQSMRRPSLARVVVQSLHMSF